jgi:hypothetical protein
MFNKEKISVKKASGEEELFSFQKLRNSLLKSKATIEEADRIVNVLQNKIYQGISTKKIYSMAFRILKKNAPHIASRYNLKRGLMELGPSGFPFERYISELFKIDGYKTEVGMILNGKCVSHEIDVICKKETTLMLMECKYKNIAGVSIDVKIPLYINSRFQDLLDNNVLQKPFTNFKGWIVTNSRFTDDALAFGKCKNIEMLGWDHPFNNSLKDIIDKTGLYPLTCLTTLSDEEKKWLLEKEIILAKDIENHQKLLVKAGINSARIKTILDESTKLCYSN